MLADNQIIIVRAFTVDRFSLSSRGVLPLIKLGAVWGRGLSERTRRGGLFSRQSNGLLLVTLPVTYGVES